MTQLHWNLLNFLQCFSNIGPYANSIVKGHMSYLETYMTNITRRDQRTLQLGTSFTNAHMMTCPNPIMKFTSRH